MASELSTLDMVSFSSPHYVCRFSVGRLFLFRAGTQLPSAMSEVSYLHRVKSKSFWMLNISCYKFFFFLLRKK